MTYRYRLATVFLMGFFVDCINIFMPAVALPTIAAEFHVGISAGAWVANAYMLGLTLAIPLAPWLADRWGRARADGGLHAGLRPGRLGLRRGGQLRPAGGLALHPGHGGRPGDSRGPGPGLQSVPGTGARACLHAGHGRGADRTGPLALAGRADRGPRLLALGVPFQYCAGPGRSRPGLAVGGAMHRPRPGSGPTSKAWCWSAPRWPPGCWACRSMAQAQGSGQGLALAWLGMAAGLAFTVLYALHARKTAHPIVELQLLKSPRPAHVGGRLPRHSRRVHGREPAQHLLPAGTCCT